ncbi:MULTISPECIES: hypothetical protein [Virgibacillus]|uniref:hypothetical protein n=1 Tax=Virgibacillus TaxID=84406 RepID=UPI0009553B4A|nr:MULTISPECIES: hypothetical protein [Virgibacillus]MBS7430415.1 hypothetical protein [Virgibacillus sp. 19R1-5]MBU8566354.1 hypothetical protein [Virgibacillus pantothenticus]MBU8600230.1 hypothetical protein [Virgibacillus pantothenticus]MBU8633838.1 hypothetical protein [Virgibacillus pantothenticus]MBU8641830.1 hypothetical protein [Virgibacillus pantothenticus]
MSDNLDTGLAETIINKANPIPWWSGLPQYFCFEMLTSDRFRSPYASLSRRQL